MGKVKLNSNSKETINKLVKSFQDRGYELTREYKSKKYHVW